MAWYDEPDEGKGRPVGSLLCEAASPEVALRGQRVAREHFARVAARDAAREEAAADAAMRVAALTETCLPEWGRGARVLWALSGSSRVGAYGGGEGDSGGTATVSRELPEARVVSVSPGVARRSRPFALDGERSGPVSSFSEAEGRVVLPAHVCRAGAVAAARRERAVARLAAVRAAGLRRAAASDWLVRFMVGLARHAAPLAVAPLPVRQPRISAGWRDGAVVARRVEVEEAGAGTPRHSAKEIAAFGAREQARRAAVAQRRLELAR